VPTILCLDDEPEVIARLEAVLREMGHRAVPAPTMGAALQSVERESVDLIIADHELPDGTGVDLLGALQREGREVPVIMTSSYHSVEQAVASIRHGAADYLTKPLRAEAVRLAVHNAIELDRMRRLQDGYQRELRSLGESRALVGSSEALRGVMEVIRSVAPTRATVLLEGESGTGKELLARAIHSLSPRSGQPFVTVNCAALPEGLVESTLFGHERGAFTGATARAAGAFERAHRGTLLLDEISEMRLDLQGKLLRVIQEQEFERVGGHQPIRVDVRLVATTNRDLRAEVMAGRFRRDLFHRLHVVPIQTPPLRERPEDIPELAEHFVRTLSAQLGIRPPALTDDALAWLREQRWPGNVRELRNTLERALILCRDGRIVPALLSAGEPARVAPPPPAPAAEPPRHAAVTPEEIGSFNLHDLERVAIWRALQSTGGHRTRAAHLLGISERTLRNKLRAG
jgi:DNA-binding NtrC family response regulator